MSSPSAADRPPSGSGYTGTGFRGIGGHLLREFPRITEPPVVPVTVPAAHGPHLVTPMLAGPDGRRSSACPVCLTRADVPHSAGGWFPIRCTACGTEFHASDGTPPPPPPAPVMPPPLAAILEKLGPPGPAVPPVFPAELTRWNLGRWVASGEPERWVAARRGSWGEMDFMALVGSLRVSGYWPVEVPEVRRVLDEATARYRAKVPPPPRMPARADPVLIPGLVETVHTKSDGSRYVICPWCSDYRFSVPRRRFAVLTLYCPGCRKSFRVMPRGARPALPPPVPSTGGNLGAWVAILVIGVPLLLLIVSYLMNRR